MRTGSPKNLLGYLAVAATLLLWSLAVVLIKLLSFYYDAMTQNFYRYLSATAVLWILNAGKLRRGLEERGTPRSGIANTGRIILPSLLVSTFQILTVQGIYLTTPTVAALIMRMNAIFINVLAYIILGEERRIIRSKLYLAGLLLAVTGATGLALRDLAELRLDVGALMVLAGTVFWACYTITVRILVKRSDPLMLTSKIFTLSTLILLIAALLAGNLAKPAQAPIHSAALLVASGALCVGLGNYMYYTALRELGAAITSSLQLLTPLLTGVFSYVILGEHPTPRIAILGSLLLVGCMLILYTAMHPPGQVREVE